jgi:hypothetical protein
MEEIVAVALQPSALRFAEFAEGGMVSKLINSLILSDL